MIDDRGNLLLTRENVDNAVVDLTQALVRIPSVFGNEESIAGFVADQMRSLGFDQVEIDEAGNAIGVVQGSGEGPTLLLDAHVDTIDIHPRGDWPRDPFSGEIAGGRLYGRGSSDMKGALAAMMMAASKADRSTLKGRVVVSASLAEEIIEGVALKAVMDRYPPDYVVIGESSELSVVRGGRGRAEFILTVPGKPAHASTPHRGVNAVHKMMRVIEAVEGLSMPRDPLMGAGVMALTDIISEPYPAHSVVPSSCRATYERRLLPGETLDGVMAEIMSACESADGGATDVALSKAEFCSYRGVRWEHPKWFPAWSIEEDHPLILAALRAVEVSGLSPKLSAYQFCTNAAYSAGEAKVPTVGLGPSTETLAHVVDEYIEIEQLQKVTAIYGELISQLLSVRSP